MPKVATPRTPRALSYSFRVSCPRFLDRFPDGLGDALWAADVEVYADDAVSPRIFEGVLFVESDGKCCLFGIENENGSGRPDLIMDDLADEQQGFIAYLRDLTARQCAAFGIMPSLIDSHVYSCERRVTESYVAARGVDLCAAVGYWSDGVYKREVISNAGE